MVPSILLPLTPRTTGNGDDGSMIAATAATRDHGCRPGFRALQLFIGVGIGQHTSWLASQGRVATLRPTTFGACDLVTTCPIVAGDSDAIVSSFACDPVRRLRSRRNSLCHHDVLRYVSSGHDMLSGLHVRVTKFRCSGNQLITKITRPRDALGAAITGARDLGIPGRCDHTEVLHGIGLVTLSNGSLGRMNVCCRMGGGNRGSFCCLLCCATAATSTMWLNGLAGIRCSANRKQMPYLIARHVAGMINHRA